MWGVECVELATGRLAWRAPSSGLVRIVGEAVGLLVVQATDGLIAIDSSTGRLRWSHDVEHPRQVRVDRQDGLVFYCRPTREDRDEPWQLAFVWLDVHTGRLRHETLVAIPDGLGRWFGPLVGFGDRMWASAADGERPDGREILELVRSLPIRRPSLDSPRISCPQSSRV